MMIQDEFHTDFFLEKNTKIIKLVEFHGKSKKLQNKYFEILPKLRLYNEKRDAFQSSASVHIADGRAQFNDINVIIVRVYLRLIQKSSVIYHRYTRNRVRI